MTERGHFAILVGGTALFCVTLSVTALNWIGVPWWAHIIAGLTWGSLIGVWIHRHTRPKYTFDDPWIGPGHPLYAPLRGVMEHGAGAWSTVEHPDGTIEVKDVEFFEDDP